MTRRIIRKFGRSEQAAIILILVLAAAGFLLAILTTAGKP